MVIGLLNIMIIGSAVVAVKLFDESSRGVELLQNYLPTNETSIYQQYDIDPEWVHEQLNQFQRKLNQSEYADIVLLIDELYDETASIYDDPRSLWPKLQPIVTNHYHLGENVLSNVLLVVQRSLQIIFNVSKLGLDFVVFIFCLIYVLQDSNSLFEKLSVFTVVIPRDIVLDCITSIRELFFVNFVLFAFHSIITYCSFNLFGLDFSFSVSVLSGFMAVVPIIS
eukprot:UN30354